VDPDPELTRLLRESEGFPLWPRLRTLLTERGIDPFTAELEESHEEDEQYEYGVVRTDTGERYEFGIDFRQTPIEQATFAEWTLLT
jgi:hypothetical protein